MPEHNEANLLEGVISKSEKLHNEEVVVSVEAITASRVYVTATMEAPLEEELTWFDFGLYREGNLTARSTTVVSHVRSTRFFTLTYEGEMDAGETVAFSSRFVKDNDFNPAMLCSSNRVHVLVVPVRS